MSDRKPSGFTHIADLFGSLPAHAQPPAPSKVTPIQARLIEAAGKGSADDPRSILYQHTVLCQTFLPYRNPGDEARSWDRRNGIVHLKVSAGEAMHPVKERLVEVGLPFGPKARLVLMHINQRALLSKSPDVNVQDSLTAFARKVLKLDTGGRTLKTLKDQLARLAASRITLGVVKDGHALTINTQIVTAFDIWFPKDERQHVLWPSVIRMGTEYFESLKAHAVPVDENAAAALSHSAMALDIYVWEAQRLHRIPKGRTVLVTWPQLMEQFGSGYTRLRKFRENFQTALKEVKIVYPEAKFSVDARGMTLQNSPPPVAPKLYLPGN